MLNVLFPPHLGVEDHPQGLGCVRGFDNPFAYRDRAFASISPSPGEVDQFCLFWDETCTRTSRPSNKAWNVFLLNLIEVLLSRPPYSPVEVVNDVRGGAALRIDDLIDEVCIVKREEDWR